MSESEFEAATVRALMEHHDLSQTDAELLTGRLWGEMGFGFDDKRSPEDMARILVGELDPRHEYSAK